MSLFKLAKTIRLYEINGRYAEADNFADIANFLTTANNFLYSSNQPEDQKINLINLAKTLMFNPKTSEEEKSEINNLLIKLESMQKNI